MIAEPGADPDFASDRITRIVTTDFPHYFAVITRIRQEIHAIGPEGGIINSSVVPQVQAIFPEGSLTKKIRVGLQVSEPSQGCMGWLRDHFRKSRTDVRDQKAESEPNATQQGSVRKIAQESTGKGTATKKRKLESGREGSRVFPAEDLQAKNI